MPLFTLTFKKSKDIKNYEIENLYSQSQKCQAYGYTHSYSNRGSRFVKCTDNNLTAICKIKKLYKAYVKTAVNRPQQIIQAVPSPKNSRIDDRQFHTINKEISKLPPLHSNLLN